MHMQMLTLSDRNPNYLRRPLRGQLPQARRGGRRLRRLVPLRRARHAEHQV